MVSSRNLRLRTLLRSLDPGPPNIDRSRQIRENSATCIFTRASYSVSGIPSVSVSMSTGFMSYSAMRFESRPRNNQINIKIKKEGPTLTPCTFSLVCQIQRRMSLTRKKHTRNSSSRESLWVSCDITDKHTYTNDACI